jgi:hypothetical protein
MKIKLGSLVNLRLERAYLVNGLDTAEVRLRHENDQQWRAVMNRRLASDTLTQRLGITQRLAGWTKF